MSRRLNNARRAMTLVEVLAAIAVIAIVLPAIMYGVTLSTSLAGVTRQRNEAIALAEAKLNELVLTGDWQMGQLSGDFGDQGPQYRWQAAVEDWEEPNLKHLQVAVHWNWRGMQREVVLDTLVYASGGVTP